MNDGCIGLWDNWVLLCQCSDNLYQFAGWFNQGDDIICFQCIGIVVIACQSKGEQLIVEFANMSFDNTGFDEM